MKKLRVTVEGKVYQVIVEILDEPSSASPAPAPAQVQSASVSTSVVSAPVSAPPAPRGAAGAGDIVSPLAGKVVSIDVASGQDVAEGTQVATVEAMKMNTYIYASKAGKVAAILVNAGDPVEEGTVIARVA